MGCVTGVGGFKRVIKANSGRESLSVAVSYGSWIGLPCLNPCCWKRTTWEAGGWTTVRKLDFQSDPAGLLL